MTLSGATTPGQSGPEGSGNEGVLYIPQSSSITESSPSDCIMSYIRTFVWVLLSRDSSVSAVRVLSIGQIDLLRNTRNHLIVWKLHFLRKDSHIKTYNGELMITIRLEHLKT